MNCRFEYIAYARNFRRPLKTAHGNWNVRRGIVIRLEDEDGRFGFGEIAPLPWFGTETQEDALQWCKKIADALDTFAPVPGNLPCCQVAVESALSEMKGEISQRTFPVAALVSGREDLENKQKLGYITFKVKIGVIDRESEFDRINALVRELDDSQYLRLDANGGLDGEGLANWLHFLRDKPVEFFEQPLARGQENAMLRVSQDFITPVALDESVARFSDLQHWSDWPGPLVIKPAILGEKKGAIPAGAVGSSVFETSFGYEAALQFLTLHQTTDRSVGFCTNEFLEEDGWFIHDQGPRVSAGLISMENLQSLWESKK